MVNNGDNDEDDDSNNKNLSASRVGLLLLHTHFDAVSSDIVYTIYNVQVRIHPVGLRQLSVFVRINPIRFLAGLQKRRLNHD